MSKQNKKHQKSQSEYHFYNFISSIWAKTIWGEKEEEKNQWIDKWQHYDTG